jgi:hypothetical protein
MRIRFWFVLLLATALGCGGGRKVAPVSGKVTMNGQPLAGAMISFQPDVDSYEDAPGSTGKTNDKGEYALTASTGESGARVGKHKVLINLWATKPGAKDAPTERGGPPLEDKVPRRYNDATELTFTVSSAGSSNADFDLKSP